jgi:hypothetical protein
MNPIDRAIALFIDDYERARNDCEDAINAALPDEYVEVSVFGDNVEEKEGGEAVVTGPIQSCISSEVAGAFEDFDWEIRRRLRELKEALQREGATP